MKVNLKKVLQWLYHLPVIGKLFSPFLKAEEKRLHERLAVRRLSDVHFALTTPPYEDHLFFLRDVSMGGLSFFLDANEQVEIFSRGKVVLVTMKIGGEEFKGKFLIAYTRGGYTGCQVFTNRQEYKKLVTEKMGDLLVKSDNFNS
jgi:hypothetical protein